MSQRPLSATQPVQTVAVAAGAVTVEVFKTSPVSELCCEIVSERDSTKSNLPLRTQCR